MVVVRDIVALLDNWKVAGPGGIVEFKGDAVGVVDADV